jgi:hypothetical protein
MRIIVNTGQVAGQVEAQEAQVTPPVGGQPEWFSKGARTFLSAKRRGKKARGLSSPRQSLMAGWKISHPARETDKVLKKILEKIGV